MGQARYSAKTALSATRPATTQPVPRRRRLAKEGEPEEEELCDVTRLSLDFPADSLPV